MFLPARSLFWFYLGCR
jgi:hypothetical protein